MGSTSKTPPRRARPVIAIDGPAGAGKSTVAKAVADRLGFIYIDTGAMYRAVALLAVQHGTGIHEPERLAALAESARFEFRRDARGRSRLHLNGADVEDDIRTPEIGRLSSPVSEVAGVRSALVPLQRAMGAGGGVVMEGRDIQTNVFPDAEVKVFLTATEPERVRRRRADLAARGIEKSLDEVLFEIRERDARDSSRSLNPLTKADDAVEILTDAMPVDEVVDAVTSLAVKAGAGGG